MALVFLTAFAGGAGAIAAWIDARFGSLAPESLQARVGAAAAAGFVLAAAPVSDSSRTIAYASVFGAVFPALVLTFLTAIWLLRAVRDARTA
jgi:hypothetical protein